MSNDADMQRRLYRTPWSRRMLSLFSYTALLPFTYPYQQSEVCLLLTCLVSMWICTTQTQARDALVLKMREWKYRQEKNEKMQG